MSKVDQYNIDQLYAVDALNIMAQMGKKSFAKVIQSSTQERMASLLKESDGEVQRRILTQLTDERLVEVFNFMQVDDITDVVGNLNSRRRKLLLDKLNSPYGEKVIELLRYSADSAGGIMTTDYVYLDESLTIIEVYNKLSEIEPTTEIIDELYILDHNKKLTGKINIRSLFIYDDDVVIKSIMDKKIKSVSPNEDCERVAMLAAKYDLVNVPVIDDFGSILGVITSDDIIDNIYKEQNEEVLNLGGVVNNGSIDVKITSSLQSRLPWLFVNLCSVFLASFIISQFDKEIEKFVGLAMVMPIIAGMGGNSGNQVLAVTIRSIALEKLQLFNNWKKVFVEILIGMINGLIVGMIAGFIIYIRFNSLRFSVVVVISMVCNFVIANTFGFTVPLVLKSLKVDPASGSSIMLTAFTDSMGFLIFLSLSKVFITAIS